MTLLASLPNIRRDYLGEGHCNYCGQRARVWSLSLVHTRREGKCRTRHLDGLCGHTAEEHGDGDDCLLCPCDCFDAGRTRDELRTELPGAFCSIACGHAYHKVMLAATLA